MTKKEFNFLKEEINEGLKNNKIGNCSYSSFPKYFSTLCLTICGAYVIIITDREVNNYD